MLGEIPRSASGTAATVASRTICSPRVIVTCVGSVVVLATATANAKPLQTGLSVTVG